MVSLSRAGERNKLEQQNFRPRIAFHSSALVRFGQCIPLLLVLVLGGCAHELGEKRARLTVEWVQIPVLYRKQGVIISIDGYKFGPRYSSVIVPAGYHEVHAVFIDCPLPMLVLTCFDSALEEIVPFEAVGGETYVLHRGATSAWVEPVSRAQSRQLPH